LRIARSGSSTTVESEGTTKAPYAGLAIMEGKLYGWTGRRLFEMDIDQSMPLASDKIRKVYDTRIDPVSTNVFSTDWWAEAIATENSVIMWYSNNGRSEIYEYKKGVGRPIWRPPQGFTIKGSCYSQGIAYFSGHWGGDSSFSGFGALYALPLNSYSPIFLKWVRKTTNDNLQMQEMCESYGMQVMVTAQRTGRIFVYDADADGLTMLDDLERSSGSDPDSLTFTNNESRVGGMVTYGPHRYATIYQPGLSSASGTYQIVYYEDDEPGQRETGLNTTDYTGATFALDSSSWDFDYPYEIKTLVGFHVAFKPLITDQTIKISYSLDEASFVDLANITSATAGASTGRVYQQVSVSGSQKKFTNLVFRITLTSATGVKPAIVYSVAAEAKLVRKREEWELVIRLKDEMAQGRTTKRRAFGSRLRDWLEETVEAGNVITLLDGYRYKRDTTGTAAVSGKAYSTHSVYIKQVIDVINEAGEGSCKVTLVAVDG
jgi:hypothetical protein